MKSKSLLFLSAALCAGVCLLLNIPRESGSPNSLDDTEVVVGGQHAGHVSGCSDCEVAKPEFPVAKTQPSLDPIFKLTGSQGGLAVPLNAFIVLEGQVVGAELAIQAAGLELAGTLTHVSDAGDRGNYIVELNDSVGRMHVATSDRRLVGEVFFYGDSRMLQFREYSMDSVEPMVVVESGRINEFYCVPSGTLYGHSGLMTSGASGLLEPLPSTLPPFEGTPAPYEIESLSGSANVLYLDFDGGAFGQAESPLLPGLVAALPHPRVNDEAWVRAVHARVAEDFAPFNINVTTARSKFEEADPWKRIHVVITPTDDAAPGTGGVAKIGSFGVDESPIVWVFNNTEYAVASTISHEAGHALGLDDDGIADGDEYYGGHNGGYAPGWAPIMGAPWADAEGALLYDEVDQWSSGEYTGASNDKNDLFLIAKQLGYVDDEYIDRFEEVALALPLTIGSLGGEEITEEGNVRVTGAGLISKTNDADVFKVEVLYDGPLILTVAPLDVDAALLELMDEAGTSGRLEAGARTQGANLAVGMELVDDTGIRIATGTNDGDADLGSLINLADLEAGTYYLIIEGAGRGDAADGFTDYASLGVYSVQAEMLAGPILVLGSNKGYQPISNGSETIDVQNATDFEFWVAGSSKPNTFQIFNPESQTITINSITLASTGAMIGTDFVVSNVPATVKAGSGKDFTIDFAPAGSGYLAGDVVTIAYTPLSSGLPATFTFTVGGTAISSASQDNYEINDFSTAAANLSAVEDTWLSSHKGLAMQPSRDLRDWYRFSVDAADDLLTVNVNYDTTLYDLTFTLKVAAGFGYIELFSSSNGSELNYLIPADKKGVYTDFYVLVEAADHSVLNTYDLKWTAISLSGGLGEDFYNNPSRETAFDLSGQDGAPLSAVQGRGILNGEDWYKITVAEDRANAYNRQLYVAAVFNDVEGEDPVNIDIEVFTDDEFFSIFNQFPTSSVSTDADKEVVTIGTFVKLEDYVGEDRTPFANNVVMGVVPDTYYIRVSSPNDYTGSSYDLTVATLSDDNYEVIDEAGTENDELEDAFELGESIIATWLSDIDGAGTMANYNSDPASPEDTFENTGDDDWYQFTLPTDETVTQFSVEYDFVADAGIVAVHDAAGDSLATASSSSGVLTIDNPTGSTFYIEVTATNSVIANLSGYDFRVTVSALPPVNEVEDDPFEDNDDYTEPYDLRGLEGLSLAAAGSYGVQFDPDWYLIKVPAGANQLQIDCLYDSSQGDLEIALWKGWGGTLPILSEDIPNGKRILWNAEDSLALAEGNYLLEVTGDNLGNLYNLSWDIARADDSYEPNDDFASARDLTATPRQWLNKVNGLGIQKDVDTYKIEVPVGSDTAQLQIRTFFDPAEGDIDLDLYYVEGPGEYGWIEGSVNSDAVEELTILNPLAGEYIVKLHYRDQGNEYDLWWAPFTQSEVDAIELANDLYEDNDTLGTAYPLGGDEVILAGIFGQGTQSDDDWYAITVSDNNLGIDIECEFQPQNGDIDVEIYDAFGGLLARSATDEGPSGPFDTAFENIGFGASLPEGTYYIRVYGANLGNPYNLYWVERSPDAFEQDDTLETATDLVTEEQTVLRVEGTQSDDDWFEIEVVSDTAFLTVDLEYVHAFGNIDFEIYDATGALFWSPPVAPDENRPDAAELINPFVESTFIAVTSGTYYIKVFGGPTTTYTEETPAFDTPGGNRWNSYTLEWGVIEDDDYESVDQNGVAIQNDTREALRDYINVEGDPAKAQHLSDLSGGTGVTINAVQFDDDWYKLTVTPGNAVLTALIRYELALGDIDLELYNSVGASLIGAEVGERDPSTITEEAPATKEDNRDVLVHFAPDALGGIYYLKVTGPGTKDSNYELVWNELPSDDIHEENDDGASATEIPEDLALANLTSRVSETFSAIDLDDDWYSFDMNPGEVQFAVSLLFNHAKGDMDFEVYDDDDPLAEPLALADSLTDDEFLIFRPLPIGGTYYIRVFGDNLGNDYTIQWASSFVDIYESSTGNNVIGDATDLLGQEGLRMKDGLGYATSGDDDWYQIEIAAGDDGVIVEAFREFASADGFVVELVNSSNVTVAFASPGPEVNPAPTVQRIRYEGPAGSYYVHVIGGLMGNVYDLLWNSYLEDVLESSGEGSKEEKKDEQNDVPDDPRGLQSTKMNETYYTPPVDGPSPNLELVLLDELTQADEDWYTFYVDDEDTILGEPADDTLIINVEFEHIQGDVDMALYFLGESGGDLAVLVDTLDGSEDVMGLSRDDNEQIRIDTGLAWGKYLLCVYGHDVEDVKPDALPITRTIDPSTDDTTALGNTYSLRWNSGYTDGFDTPLTNNDLASATDLGFLDDLNGPRERDDRFLTQFDEDWYQIEVRSDTVHQLYARIDFEHVKGDLTLRLLDENGNLLLESTTALDREVLLPFGDGTATYYLQVVGEDLGTPYNLYMRAYNDDIYEDNDTFDTPADVRGEQDDLMTRLATGVENIADTIFERGIISGIQLDDDYYLISVPNDSVHLSVRFFSNIGLAGDFDVGYTVLSIDEVARSTAAESYNLIDPEGSNYVIHVTGDDVGTPYDLVWEIDNVDKYDSRGGISYPNYFSNTAFDEVSQSSHNNDWENAYDLIPTPRLAPTYDNKIKYKTAIRDLIYDEAVLATRYNSGSSDNRDFAVGHATQQDDDWYRVQMPSWELVTAKQGTKDIKVLKRIYNTSLQVDLAYEHADGNIDVEIYDVDDLGDDDVTNDVLTLLSALSLADDNVDLESIRVPVDPLNEDRVYAIRVSGDNIGNDYSLIWEERTDDLYEVNNFVDTSHDLTLSSDVGDAATGPLNFSSTEGKWLHELWQHNDANGNGTIEAGEMMNRRYGNQSTDDWYAVAVSDGSEWLEVQANFYADDNTDHTYDPDDLDFAIDLYRLVEDTTLGIRKPILIGRINDNDKETEPFPARPHPIDGDLDYPLTERDGAIDLDTGERIEFRKIPLVPDLLVEGGRTGGIYFIRIFYDNRNHPYTFKWDDNEADLGVVDRSDANIIDDYLNGAWSYIPDLTLPEDILNPGAGDANGNGYPDWFEVALVLNPDDYAIPGETVEAGSNLRDAVVGMIRTVDANGVEDEYYTVTYLRSTEAVALGFEFTVQQKQNLADPVWGDALAEQEVSVEIVAPGIERVVYRAPVPTDEQPMYYFRVSVTEPAIP